MQRVACASDGDVYACGQEGTLVRGNKGKWSLLEGPSQDLWDIHAFGDSVFAASFSGLLEIKGGKVKEIDLDGAGCHRLTSAEGVLWSVGAEDIFSYDGRKWTRAV